MQIKNRKFEIALADAGNGLTLSPSNLGFNPSHGYRKVQISTNDCGGTFSLEVRPAGSDEFYPFTTQVGANADCGEDVILAGRADDPVFDALKLSFAGTTADIVVYCGFINEDD